MECKFITLANSVDLGATVSIHGMTNTITSPVLPASLYGLTLFVQIDFTAQECEVPKILTVELMDEDGEPMFRATSPPHQVGPVSPGRIAIAYWPIPLPREVTIGKPGTYVWHVYVDDVRLPYDYQFYAEQA